MFNTHSISFRKGFFNAVIANCILCKIDQWYKRLERKLMKFDKSNEPWINAVTSLSFVLQLKKNMRNKKVALYLVLSKLFSGMHEIALWIVTLKVIENWNEVF